MMKAITWILLGLVMDFWVLPPASADSASDDATLEEVVVSARKKDENLVNVPISVSALSGNTLEELNIQNFEDFAMKVPNVSFNYGGGGYQFTGSRSTVIRGVYGTNTTAFYLDDTPVPSTVDPRIVDLDRIEVLRGPQGTLYGTASMGGNVKYITKQPSLETDDLSFMAQSGDTSGAATPDFGGTAVGGAVLVPGTLGVRGMLEYQHDGGYLTRTFPDPNDPAERESVGDQGRDVNYGGSLALRAKFTDNFETTLKILYQDELINGWPTAYAPLPAFQVQSYTLNRQADIQGFAHDRWYLPSLALTFKGEGWAINSSTSYFDRDLDQLEDATEGTSEFIQLFYDYFDNYAPQAWGVWTDSSQITHETRFSIDRIFVDDLSGIFGVYLNHQHSFESSGGPHHQPLILPGLEAAGLWPNDVEWDVDTTNKESDYAVFGELYYKFLEKFTLTLGFRDYRIDQSVSGNYAGFAYGPTYTQSPIAISDRGFVPKFSLAYQATQDAMVYATAAQGFRPGGQTIPLPQTCDAALAALGFTQAETASYKPDKLWSYEVGAKADTADHKLTVTSALFQINWSELQQTIAIPCGYSFTGNAGAARIRGGEIELDGRPIDGVPVDIRLGFGYNNAVITQASSGSPQAVGSPILEDPKVTATAGLTFNHPITAQVAGFVSTDYSYRGYSYTTNDSTTPLKLGGYEITNARAGVRWNNSELSLYVNNVFNVHANLGDLLSEAYNEVILSPSNTIVAPHPMVAVTRPLAAGLQYRWHFN